MGNLSFLLRKEDKPLDFEDVHVRLTRILEEMCPGIFRVEHEGDGWFSVMGPDKNYSWFDFQVTNKSTVYPSCAKEEGEDCPEVWGHPHISSKWVRGAPTVWLWINVQARLAKELNCIIGDEGIGYDELMEPDPDKYPTIKSWIKANLWMGPVAKQMFWLINKGGCPPCLTPWLTQPLASSR